MTKKELNQFIDACRIKGYKIKKGYCCYQYDNLSIYDLLKISSNYGIYGWNWTLYFYPDTKTIYVSGYRNY